MLAAKGSERRAGAKRGLGGCGRSLDFHDKDTDQRVMKPGSSHNTSHGPC